MEYTYKSNIFSIIKNSNLINTLYITYKKALKGLSTSFYSISLKSSFWLYTEIHHLKHRHISFQKVNSKEYRKLDHFQDNLEYIV